MLIVDHENDLGGAWEGGRVEDGDRAQSGCGRRRGGAAGRQLLMSLTTSSACITRHLPALGRPDLLAP